MRPDARTRIRTLLRAPGPYVSAYTMCGELASVGGDDEVSLFEDRRAELARAGASAAALDAVSARLKLPPPDDVGGRAVHAAADGTTIADFAPEGPAHPVFRVDSLPLAGPLLEWDQWRVPHVTLMAGEEIAELVVFLPGMNPSILPSSNDPTDIAEHCRRLAHQERLRLVAIGGDPVVAADLSARLRGVLPTHTVVADVSDPDGATSHALAERVVRMVADVVARDTVAALEDFRFLRAAYGAVEGAPATLEALAAGRGRRLLVHDDPTDQRQASFGDSFHELSADPERYPNSARLVDLAICVALARDLAVRLIPGTADNGPAEDIALTVEPSPAEAPLGAAERAGGGAIGS